MHEAWDNWCRPRHNYGSNYGIILFGCNIATDNHKAGLIRVWGLSVLYFGCMEAKDLKLLYFSRFSKLTQHCKLQARGQRGSMHMHAV